ncbi:hypothetical protein MiSe_94580 [Microseira wollei NIES-4236]|uniref:Uncharacterized protein n=1 Tax=Microseira wollei NIES-4236 TaxID=2530354 RepID=A0AAV3XNW7_9CYAN|nr:hypothetical protein MiSe_94580 [Microseira wollei NIES-4236]
MVTLLSTLTGVPMLGMKIIKVRLRMAEFGKVEVISGCTVVGLGVAIRRTAVARSGAGAVWTIGTSVLAFG